MGRPNVVMITCHDIGQHLCCYGIDTVQTPHLDALAARGVRFENFFSTSAVCSPARGSLHTGRYPQSNGLMGLTHAPWWWKIRDDERHTATILADHGYETVLDGFNHIHPDPERLGYQRALSQGFKAPETVTAFRDFVQKRETDTPFFVKVGFHEVHRKFTHGKNEEKGVFIPGWLQDTPEIRSDLAEFQATIKYFDERVGEVLEAIEQSGAVNDTLIIMTSDHGIPYPGAKWTVRKAGIEVPLIMYQPNSFLSGGRVLDALMSNVDVLPTLLEFLEIPVPANVQGVSFKSFIEGCSDSFPRNEAFAQYTPEMKRDNTSRCVITERYHLIRYFDAGRALAYPVAVHPQRFADHVERCRAGETRPFAQLYDWRNDPYELKDIGSKPENREIVENLSRRLLHWMKEVNDPLLQGPVRTPYYERAMEDLLGPR